MQRRLRLMALCLGALALGACSAVSDLDFTVAPPGTGGMGGGDGDAGGGDGDAAMPSCETDTDCDDMAHCNGVERCVDGACVAGDDPCTLDDGVSCTDVSCDEDTDSCIQILDGDGDGVGAADVTACPGAEPGDDCDDGRADVYLGAPELCDAADNDCDEVVDEEPEGEPEGGPLAFVGGQCLPYTCGAGSACEGEVFVQLGMALYFGCGLTEGGDVYCWGRGTNGQLGHGRVPGQQATPQKVLGLSGVVQISVSTNNACAIHGDDRALSCWGAGGYGRNGDGTVVSRNVPVAVVDQNDTQLTGILEVSRGADHACAIKSDGNANGTVYCWGRDAWGQLGDAAPNPYNARAREVRRSGGGFLDDALHVAVSDRASCAVVFGGDVVCWGSAYQGAVGNCQQPTTNPSVGLPRTVTYGDDDNGCSSPKDLGDAVDIAGGRHSFCALRAGGEIACWGWGTNGQRGRGFGSLGLALDVIDEEDAVIADFDSIVDGADLSFCARREDGTPLCWGRGVDTQLPVPLQRSLLFGAAAPVMLDGFSGESIGGRQGCAIADADGRVVCWGMDHFGERGDGAPSDRFSPGLVSGLSNIVGVTASEASSCAVDGDGAAHCWGWGRQGVLGQPWASSAAPHFEDRIIVPRPLLGMDGMPLAVEPELMAMLPVTTCAVTTGGVLQCVGDNDRGELGQGEGGSAYVETPVVVDVPGTITAIDGEIGHLCAVADEKLYCWGDNTTGELGRGTGAQFMSDVGPVTVPADRAVLGVAVSQGASCAIVAPEIDGDPNGLHCWGRGGAGEHGTGVAANTSAVPDTAALTGVSQVVAGRRHFCALLEATDMQGRDVYCWGSNVVGQVGDGTVVSPVGTPSGVPLPGRPDTLDAGRDYTCALRRGTDGWLYCWGDAAPGRTGWGQDLSSAGVQPLPRRVPVYDVVALTVGSGATTAPGVRVVHADGSVSAWGGSDTYVLGRGTQATPRCGNGEIEAGEACDDGNQMSDDGCTGACEVATCGDGFVQVGVETCDEGRFCSDGMGGGSMVACLEDFHCPDPETCEVMEINGCGLDCVGVDTELIGCADGVREGFDNEVIFRDIAGCAGGWDVPGVLGGGSTCDRLGGNNSSNQSGLGCSAEDLCEVGFHLCESEAEIWAASRNYNTDNFGGCAEVGTNNSSFFVAAVGGHYCQEPFSAPPMTLPGSEDGLVGCGDLGVDDPDCTRQPLGLGSGDLCDFGSGMGTLAPWDCGDDGEREAAAVIKTGTANGGVLCCRDTVIPSPYPANCTELAESDPMAADGTYLVDPDGSGSLPIMPASCQIDGNGVGWTLAFNYVHAAGTTPELLVLDDALPLLGSGALGADEEGLVSWGHASEALLGVLDPTELWFYGRSGGHGRVMNFTTDDADCIDYVLGTRGGSANCIGVSGNSTTLAGHTTGLPANTNGAKNDAETDQALTQLPFFEAGVRYWNLDWTFRNDNTVGVPRWEMDDNTQGNGRATIHRVWVRSGN